MLRMDTIQYNLPQDRIPRAWYNVIPDLPKPMAPPLHPGTHKPIGPDDLAPLFPMSLTARAASRRPWTLRRTSTTSTKA
jgi:tryptophan synthase beta chain